MREYCVLLGLEYNKLCDWSTVMSRTGIIKKILFIIAAILLMTIWWSIRMQDASAREEIILDSSYPLEFTAQFSEVHGFAFCSDALGNSVDNPGEEVRLQLQITDNENNVVWKQQADNVQIGSSEFVESKQYESLPIILEVGKNYKITYESENLEPNSLTIAILGRERGFFIYYLIFCTFLFIVIVSSLFFLLEDDGEIKVSKFIIVYLLIGITYMFVLIPFSVQDEPTHFAQAYAISSEWLGQDSIDEYGRVYVYQNGLRRINWCGNAHTQYRFWSDWSYGNIPCKEISIKYVYSSVLHRYVYYAPALGITIARIMALPYQFVLLFGRLTNFMLFVLICWLALRINRKMQRSIMAIMLLPQVIWLGISMSYDAWNMAFSILLFSYCMYCREKETLVSWKDMLILASIGILLAPVKFIYFVMAFAVLLIPYKAFKNHWYQFMCYGSTIISALLAALIARGSSAVNYATTETVDVRSVDIVNLDRQRYTIQWVLYNPIRTIKVYLNTMFEQTENYIYKGINGEIIEAAPKIIIFSILAIMILIMMDEVNAMNNYHNKDRIISIGIIATGCGLVLTTFLFVYSFVYEYSIGIIEGVHGRYFLPFICFLPLAIRNSMFSIPREKKNYLIIGMIILSLVVLICDFEAIVRG